MRLLCLLLCITYANCFYINNNQTSKEKIFGGHLAQILYLPYHAALYYVEAYICGAVIITKDWLLSAEKCFTDLPNLITHIKVRTGTMQRSFGQLKSIAKIEIFSRSFPGSDIETNLALVLLSRSLKFNSFQNRINMSISHEDPLPNKEMSISGFGQTSSRSSNPSPQLVESTVKVLPRSNCHTASERLFCAASPGSDACNGDLGGPGVVDGKVVAIITGKPRCGALGSPTAYSKVGYFYPWIWQKTLYPIY